MLPKRELYKDVTVVTFAEMQYMACIENGWTSFKELLLAYKEFKYFSVNELSLYLDIKRPTLSTYWNRDILPNRHKVPAIADKLHIEPIVLGHIITQSQSRFDEVSDFQYVLYVMCYAFGKSTRELFYDCGYSERVYSPIIEFGEITAETRFAYSVVSKLLDVSTDTIYDMALSKQKMHLADFEFLYKVYSRIEARMKRVVSVTYIPDYTCKPESLRISKELSWLSSHCIVSYKQLVDALLMSTRSTYTEFSSAVYGNRNSYTGTKQVAPSYEFARSAAEVLGIHEITLAVLVLTNRCNSTLEYLVHLVTYSAGVSIENLSEKMFDNRLRLRNLIAKHRVGHTDLDSTLFYEYFDISDIELLRKTTSAPTIEQALKSLSVLRSKL